MMGFITVVSTLSFLFTGPHRHSFFPSTRCTSLCLEGSLDSSNNNEQQALSVFNRTVAKHGIEKALGIYRERNTAFKEKYGSVFNATVEKHGLEKALEIARANGRKAKEKYGTVWDRMKLKYGLEKATEIRNEAILKRTEKYGSIFNATVQKHGLDKAIEIYSESGRKGLNVIEEKYGSPANAIKAKYGLEGAREIFRKNSRKANEALFEKYTIEEIQQMGSTAGVESARKRGWYSRYPGVHFNRAKGRWSVQFKNKGNIYRAGAAHASEKEAALAHDECVRNLGLNRPLHFPREGERTSYIEDTEK